MYPQWIRQLTDSSPPSGAGSAADFFLLGRPLGFPLATAVSFADAVVADDVAFQFSSLLGLI